MSVSISTEELGRAAPTLRAGDRVLLSGTVYTARDAAHKRLCALLDQGKPLPFDLRGAVIYYAGSTPGQKGMAVGGAGALIARQIRTEEVVAFEDLGCESIKKMSVAEFPLTVAIDSQGSDLYQTGREIYRHG